MLRDEGLIYTIHGQGSFITDITGEFSIDYTPPAWYLAKKAKSEPDGEGGEGEPDDQPAGPSLTELLTALRDEIRALSAEHQELRREVEALKKAQQ
ncbi:SCO5717 family growth-regulating ATPase [Streptomyces sp. NPDC008343]|uniref:SCO5717 family growth-regulating ATPase n=1 Tax=Streptomyces sp. NPDC008343 TaxID=3364828 RepID=UPI0036E298F3